MSSPHDSVPAVSDHGGSVPATQEPIPDPGLHKHTWRPTDVDDRLAKRAERQIAAMFVLSMLCAVLFVVAYFTLEIGDSFDTVGYLGASTVALGLSLAGALLFIGVGVIQWARKLMSDVEISEPRHPAKSSDADRAATLQSLDLGAKDSGIGRRPLIRNTMLGAVGLLGLPALVILRDLGPLPGDRLARTIWQPGMRLVRDVLGTPVKPSDMEVGDLINAAPEALFPTEENGYEEIEGVELNVEKAKGAIIIVRMEPGDIVSTQGDNWSVDGIVSFSKICTHVGCPISLYERTTHHVLCPCHQSTFDLADSAKVVFGPAARPLPQLPLAVNEDGYLIAQSDFTEPIGASYWEREKES